MASGPEGPPLPERRIDLPAELLAVQQELYAAREELHKLKNKTSLKKNGEPWSEYLSRWVNPQSLVSLGVFLFVVGMRWAWMETGVSGAKNDAAKAAIAAEHAATQQRELRAEIVALRQTVSEQHGQLLSQPKLYVTKLDLDAAVKGGVSTLVTRREWRELLDLQKANAERLMRIEGKVDAR